MNVAFHDVLNKIFICITFHWSVRRLPTLQLVLQTYTGYPINVEVCVITNAPERLTNVMHTRWNFTSVSLCGARREMTHAFQLAWEHRDIMELAYEKGDHSLFIYAEDDVELTWPSLRAWAADESLLAPVGLHRGFVRVETAQWDGRLIANDQLHNVSLSTAGADVSIAPSLHGDAHGAASHFVHLASSYQAMWVASRMQLALWMRGPEWGAARNGYTDNPSREDAAHNLYSLKTDHFQLQGLRGILSSLVVPYDPVARRVLQVAGIAHLDTKESDCSLKAPRPAGTAHCTIYFDDLLVA